MANSFPHQKINIFVKKIFPPQKIFLSSYIYVTGKSAKIRAIPGFNPKVPK